MKRPVATYRLQLHEGFTLRDAARIAPQLRRLGISHLYLSPITQATSGSEHGYDVTDPTRINEELGGADAMEELAAVLRELGMGVLLDIVPNHMAASAENAWWADLLLNGTESQHVSTFDTSLLRSDGKLLLPVLGAPLDEVLAAGELQLTERNGRRVLQYHNHWFPVPGWVTATEVTAELLASLPYTLADWRTVQEQSGYRRFFDITGLVGVRVEDPTVFERTHSGILQWLEAGWVDALRIDHIDGLRDPAGYLRQLADATAKVRPDGRCYTVVEKILASDEHLPRQWEADGATGYEFMRVVSSFLVDPSGYHALEDLLRRVTGDMRQFDDVVYGSKLDVMDTLFPAELREVSNGLASITGLPTEQCTRVLRELTAALDVYRTYTSADGGSDDDRMRIDRALATAQTRLSDSDRAALNTIRNVLLLELEDSGADLRDRALDVAARWQQLSGPVMAKGFEDTALYRWPALLAVNEVGGEPGESMDAAAVHEFLAYRAEHDSGALNATSTHDSKRSEDVRARLMVLSGRAREWTAAVEAWLPRLRDGVRAVAPRDELLLLQTVSGAWPLDGDPDETFRQRIREYMRKAAREAKQETSWLDPDEAYEEALFAYVDRLLVSPGAADVRNELRGFVQRIALHGAVNSLAQVVIRCAAPGIPDTYQGTDRWRFDLVDPDNRRPVDYDQMAAFASSVEKIVEQPDAASVSRLRETWRDGRLKLYVLMALLRTRGRNKAFTGAYEPIEVTGERAEHVLAFRRHRGADSVIAVVPRWPARLAPAHEWPLAAAWGDTMIEVGDGALRSVLDGTPLVPERGRLRLADVLSVLPVALLEGV